MYLVEREGEISSFLEVIPPKPSLKVTFLILLAGLGITGLSLLVNNISWVITRGTPIGEFLFPFEAWAGRGFTLPVLDAVFRLVRNNDYAMFEAIAQFIQNLTGVEQKLTIAMGIAPVLEEIRWGGLFYVTRSHSDKKWWNIAFIVSATLFALCHPVGIGRAIGPFSVGIASWLIIKKTKRLWPAMVCHALYNGQVELNDWAWRIMQITQITQIPYEY